MHGQKKRRKRTIEGEATIDGLPLAWSLTSEPQWSNNEGEGYKGMCISVKVIGQARRELIVEYPFPTGRNGLPLPVPQRPPISASLVEASIRQAIAAGWDPGSRGKPFVFYAPAPSA
jgi:hypothetical protein